MTSQEVSERYKIPMEVLGEYERWGLEGAGKQVVGEWQYDSRDLERLSLILTLRDIGFSAEDTETYMRLTLAHSGSEKARLRMLEQKRRSALDEIHFLEKQVAHMDYLRNEIKKEQA